MKQIAELQGYPHRLRRCCYQCPRLRPNRIHCQSLPPQVSPSPPDSTSAAPKCSLVLLKVLVRGFQQRSYFDQRIQVNSRSPIPSSNACSQMTLNAEQAKQMCVPRARSVPIVMRCSPSDRISPGSTLYGVLT